MNLESGPFCQLRVDRNSISSEAGLLDDDAKSELDTIGGRLGWVAFVNDSNYPLGDGTFDHISGYVTVSFDTYNETVPFILTPVAVP